MKTPKIDQQLLRKMAKIFGWAALIMWPGASLAHYFLMWISPDYLSNMLGYLRFGAQFNTRPFLLNFPVPGVMCAIVWVLLWIGILVAKLRAKMASAS
jgi:hypothetical protein